MLITPRLYGQLQNIQEGPNPGSLGPLPAIGWRVSQNTVNHRQKMLLVHQVGSVRVGEVVRYFGLLLEADSKADTYQLYTYIYTLA